MVCFLSLSSAALQTSHSAGHWDQFMIMTGGINYHKLYLFALLGLY